MTPAPPQLSSPRPLVGVALTAVLAFILLACLFLPARDPVTRALTVQWRPSAEVAGLVFLAALAVLARPRLAIGGGLATALAGLVTALALLNFADAATPALLGRDLNLYWDLRHLPSLWGLARESAGLWYAGAATVIAIAAVLLVLAGAYWAWRRMILAFADRRIAIGAAVLLGVALDLAAFVPAEQRPFATTLGRDIVRHAAAFERGWQASAGAGGPLPAALATSGPPGNDLPGLKHRDVYLVYIESYGTAVFDTPEFYSALRGPLSQLAATLRASGYNIASNRLISPTFGGGSWLAHATLASGVRLDDPVLYSQLLASGRKLLPGYFKDAGWRAINVMPGIKAPAPEARAWGFDREIYAAELGYRGPSFGWFAIPDQFTLGRATAIRTTLGSEPPVFTQIVLVSSHIPFSPVPPYLADWADAGSFATVPEKAWAEIYRQPDWADLAPGYLKSLQYDFTVLGDWLTKHVEGDGLVILLGDHQPPAAVGGKAEQWTVPIHILSRDPDLVAPFTAAGYVPGLIPTQAPPNQRMESFLSSFLAAFDRPG